MKELWIHFGRPNIGTQTEDFINIANILCNTDISSSFKQLLYTAEKFELTDILSMVGVDTCYVKYKKLNGVETFVTDTYSPYIGALYKAQNLGVSITSVQEDSHAANAGLAVGDVLISVDNIKISEQSLQQLAEHLLAHQEVPCHYFRDDQLIASQIAFIDSPKQGLSFKVVNEALVKKWQSIHG